MTGIEQKALALVNEMAIEECEEVNLAPHKTLCAALRLSVLEHEDTKMEFDDFRQEVSDAVEMALKNYPPNFLREHLHQFIIPKPKPDPLVDALAQMDFVPWKELSEHADDFRAALDARGLEIREKSDD